MIIIIVIRILVFLYQEINFTEEVKMEHLLNVPVFLEMRQLASFMSKKDTSVLDEKESNDLMSSGPSFLSQKGKKAIKETHTHTPEALILSYLQDVAVGYKRFFLCLSL